MSPSKRITSQLLLAGFLAGNFSFSQTSAPPPPPQARAANSPLPAGARIERTRFSQSEARFYRGFWGVDSLSVRSVESGELIRFTYRVVDAERAKPLNDKKNEPSLIDPQAQVKLVIPSLEKVGQLRQSSTPIAGKSYWMAFSNKGRPVKPGDHVTVVIGPFHAQNLIVE